MNRDKLMDWAAEQGIGLGELLEATSEVVALAYDNEELGEDDGWVEQYMHVVSEVVKKVKEQEEKGEE